MSLKKLMYVFVHNKNTRQKMIWSWIICYFSIISQIWQGRLAFILQTTKLYYLHVWLFIQRTRTLTIISTDYVISWIASKVDGDKSTPITSWFIILWRKTLARKTNCALHCIYCLNLLPSQVLFPSFFL